MAAGGSPSTEPKFPWPSTSRLAHRPRLGHVHERRVNHRFAVRMIITAGVAADFRALAMLPSREQREIVHRVKNAALRGLQGRRARPAARGK